MTGVWKNVDGLGLVIGALLIVAGCVGSKVLPPHESIPPPAWLNHLPASKEDLCAVGISGPTYYPEDAMANSTAQAFSELSRSVQVRIKSHLAVEQKGDSLGRSEVTVEETSAFMSEVVLKLVHVRDRWVSPSGHPTHGEQGSVYTLVCMPLGMSAADLGRHLQGHIPAANPRRPLLLKQTEAMMKEWAQ